MQSSLAHVILFSLALAVSADIPPSPCSMSPTSSYPFCDPSLPLRTRVDDLVSRLSLNDTVFQLVNLAPSVPSINLPSYDYWSEALHGILADGATSYPQVIGLGASFNSSLWLHIGIAISSEGRAFYQTTNEISGINFFAPNINIFRDPRWGRGQETPGEDPFLSALYVSEYVQGMQGHPSDPLFDPRYVKVGATCKHFDAYSLEKWDGVDRHHFDAIVSDPDFQDTYLPVFRACVERAKVKSFMCSYNAVNGVPSCANAFLQQTIVREQWGWNGFIVSDCGAIFDIQHTHHFTDNVWDTCQVAIQGGCDLNCGSYYEKCAQAVEHQTLSEKELKESLARVLVSRFELGLFDPPATVSYESIGSDMISSKEHAQLALEAARQSMVLLKNSQVLPLEIESVGTVAMIGPNANASLTLLGNYYGLPNSIVTPLQGMKDKGVTTLYAEGCTISGNSTQGFDEAVATALKSDVVIFVMGIDQTIESEGLDRYSISLPGVQRQLMETVTNTLPATTATVLVLINGGPLDISVEQNYVDAVLEAFYPGQSGGSAIADVLFGLYNPGGRLPYTMYNNDYVDQVSMFDMNMRPNSTYPGRTYKYFTEEPVYPFGYGLSYTSFSYSYASQKDLLVSSSAPRSLSYRVNITNTGPIPGNEVVLAIYEPIVPINGLRQQLFGFERVYLQPGETQEVVFFMNAGALGKRDSFNSSAKQGLYFTDSHSLTSLVLPQGKHLVRIGSLKFNVTVE